MMITAADLAAVRNMAAAIDQEVTLESWIETETQMLSGDDARRVEAECRAVWAQEV